MQTRKHEAIPQSLRKKLIDPTSTLEYITTQISGIYTAAKSSDINDDDDDQALHIDHGTYAKTYTATFDICIATIKTPTAAINCATLFQFLNEEIVNYSKYMRDNHFSFDGNGIDEIAARKMLTAYLSCHRRLLKIASLVRRLVRYWDRHLVRHQWALRKIKVASVEELHKMVWKEEVLEKEGLEVVVDAIAMLRKSDGGMAEYDSVLVKDVVESLSGLGITL